MTWSMEGSQGNEAAKVKYDIVPYTRGTGLDLGCGPSKPYAHFIGVDNRIDTKLFGVQMAPDISIETCEKLAIFADEAFDFVFSSHLLEHIVDYKAALAEWWRVIKPGGHLVLYLPDATLYPNIGQEGANPDHKHDFIAEDILEALRTLPCMTDFGRLGFRVIVNERRDQGNEYSFLLVIQKDALAGTVSEPAPRREKTVCVVRYGGYGDQIQASGVLPELKRQGYHVTMMTTPKGKAILERDPHIDEWILQDEDQVPNGELGPYWAVWKKKFDRWINLSESVERSLLAMPGSTCHSWPHEMRHKHLNVNYGEFVADIACLPYKSEARFYPTEEEKNWAQKFTEMMGGFTILWALSGSSVHKFTPHQDSVIAALMMLTKDIHVIFTGDEACQILEVGWENEPRVHRYSNKLSIRQSLTLATMVDCVVGPETGILNAVAFEQNAKVVFLSHSSKENLTKHWKNTASLMPVAGSTPCYPCHRLHYDSTFCPLDEHVGAALCQMNTRADDATNAIMAAYKMKKAGKKVHPLLSRLIKAVS